MAFDFTQFTTLVKTLTIGKKLPDAIYIHRSAITTFPQPLIQLTTAVATNLKIDNNWNIIKLYRRDFKLAFLYYPDFETYAYPALHRSVTVDLTQLTHRTANYSQSKNPPILHRKECFVKPNHPQYDEFKAITKEGEAAGLYVKVHQIGFKNNWEKSITNKGLILSPTGRLKNQPKSKPTKATPTINKIDRHLTAIDRHKLSAPMQTLAKNGYLNGDYTLLDYGCGKGDDAAELEAHGLDIASWDPNHHPEGQLIPSDIVNLGFVINVIEDQTERSQTLTRAFNLTTSLLVVSAMVAGESIITQFTPYKDGVITQRNTFQKYYGQSELKSYLETTLKQNTIAASQGIFYVFKDKVKEQDYLLGRQKTQLTWHNLTFNDKPPADTTSRINRAINNHPEIFKDFWRHSLAYTKMPDSLKRDIKYFFDNYKHAIDIATKALFSVGSPAVIEAVSTEAYQTKQRGEFNQGHSWVIKRTWIAQLPPELRIYIGCATQLYGDIEAFELVKIHFNSGKVSLMRFDDWRKSQPLLIERIKIKLREQDIDFFDYSTQTTPAPLLTKAMFTGD